MLYIVLVMCCRYLAMQTHNRYVNVLVSVATRKLEDTGKWLVKVEVASCQL